MDAIISDTIERVMCSSCGRWKTSGTHMILCGRT